MKTPPISLFGIRITVCDYDEVLTLCTQRSNEQQSTNVTYTHFDTLLQARSTPSIASMLNDATVNYPDGIGIHWAITILTGISFARINASDMNRCLLEHAIRERWKVMTIGGNDAVAGSFEKAFQRHGGRMDCIQSFDGYRELSDAEIHRRIESFKPDILFLGMGGRRQFEWLEFLQQKDIPLSITAGGFLEFFAGTKPRAPAWMRRLGLEWLHRLWLEPGRMWRRYILGIPRFIALVILERMKKKR